MSYTIELNNATRDENLISGNIKKNSPVVEVFAAMSAGKDLSRFSKATADKAASYIKELSQKADAKDMSAIAELNEIRKMVIQPILAEELKLLSLFGNYQALGYNDSLQIEVTDYLNTGARVQALGQDVNFPALQKRKVGITTTTISAGYAVDYRKAQLGDMSDEYRLQEEVRKDMRNKAAKYVMDTVLNALRNATGIKYMLETSPLTKTAIDDVLTKVRRWGRPTITGDFALVSQLNGFAGYQGVTPNVAGISQKIMDEINETGLLGMYNGAVVAEMPNAYDVSKVNTAGDNFETVFPAGLGFVIPQGGQSPVYTVSRGGLTTLTGTDITTGQIISRFDWEVGALVLPGQEYKLAVIHDTSLDNL